MDRMPLLDPDSSGGFCCVVAELPKAPSAAMSAGMELSTPMDIKMGLTSAADVAHPLRWGFMTAGRICADMAQACLIAAGRGCGATLGAGTPPNAFPAEQTRFESSFPARGNSFRRALLGAQSRRARSRTQRLSRRTLAALGSTAAMTPTLRSARTRRSISATW